jgi:phosphoglycolate phosphatase-like HAD superfamily hydrolase
MLNQMDNLMISIVFDLDGTLIDSAPDLRAAVNQMMDDEGQEAFDLPTITSFIGNGLPRLVELAMGARDMEMTRHAALTTDVLGHYKSANGAYTMLYPGVMDALNTLKTNGHLLGLCTNKPIDATRDVLEQFALGDLFDAIIGGDSLASRINGRSVSLRHFRQLSHLLKLLRKTFRHDPVEMTVLYQQSGSDNPFCTNITCQRFWFAAAG